MVGFGCGGVDEGGELVGGGGEVGECGAGFGVTEELDFFVEEGFGDFGPDGPYETSVDDECFGGVTCSRVVDLL